MSVGGEGEGEVGLNREVVSLGRSIVSKTILASMDIIHGSNGHRCSIVGTVLSGLVVSLGRSIINKIILASMGIIHGSNGHRCSIVGTVLSGLVVSLGTVLSGLNNTANSMESTLLYIYLLSINYYHSCT